MTSTSPVTWAPLGTTIVSWEWLAVPDKYAGPKRFRSYEDAEAYAAKTLGRVEVDYDLRAPTGALWSVTLWARGTDLHGDAVVGSVVVDRRYELWGDVAPRGPAVATPEEAEAQAAGDADVRFVHEWLTFRTPDGECFEARAGLLVGRAVSG